MDLFDNQSNGQNASKVNRGDSYKDVKYRLSYEQGGLGLTVSTPCRVFYLMALALRAIPLRLIYQIQTSWRM